MVKDRILWLDLETTGSDDDSEILEIGLALTDENLLLVDATSFLVQPKSPDALVNMNPIVDEMHTANGLKYDLLAGKGNSIEHADTLCNVWLDNNGIKKTHIPFAGSGVLHFDRQFIRKYLPVLDRRLTYWAYDVGVMRRVLRDFAGLSFPKAADKTHRALDDVFQHIDEMKIYVNLLKGLE